MTIFILKSILPENSVPAPGFLGHCLHGLSSSTLLSFGLFILSGLKYVSWRRHVLGSVLWGFLKAHSANLYPLTEVFNMFALDVITDRIRVLHFTTCFYKF